MRFMLLRKADTRTEAGEMPSRELLKHMIEYNDALVRAGALRAGEGLHPSIRGVRVKFERGKPKVSRGPFPATTELVAGFTMIEAGSLDEAIDWVQRWPPSDGNGEAEIEIRQVFETADFGPACTPELEAREEAQRAQIAARPISQATPYLFFDGRCEEALEFYRRALGAQVTMLMRFGESPDPAAAPPGAADKVMHAAFRIGNATLMASDGMCTGATRFQGFSLSLDPATEAEAKRLFAALSDGGTVQMPLAKTFFSPCFGMVADRFGVSWMIIVAQQG